MTTSTPNLASVVQVPPIGRDGLLDYRWRRFFDLISKSVEPVGTGTVIDGSNTTYGQMVLFQGPDTSKPGTPATGSIYFALDTGNIYWANSGTWSLLSEELTGDVTKPANSNVTSLANVFPDPGTYGSATQTPVLTIDSKGRVTGLYFETIAPASATPVGPSGALQFNDAGAMGGSTQILYNPVTGGFVFSNPGPTREALSPLTTKGDIFVRNATESTRLPVGTNGQYLAADSAEATGLKWLSPSEVEIRFYFGDATPKPLVTVPANKVIQEVLLTIITPFDDPASTLAVEPGLLATTDNLPTQAGSYGTVPGVEFGTSTLLTLNISPGTSTQGMGVVTINFAS